MKQGEMDDEKLGNKGQNSSGNKGMGSIGRKGLKKIDFIYRVDRKAKEKEVMNNERCSRQRIKEPMLPGHSACPRSASAPY